MRALGGRFAFAAAAVASLVACGCSGGATSASAPASFAGYAAPGTLKAVAAASAANAWAIGYVDSGLPLVVHWNGTTWRTVPITVPGSTQLEAVAVSSPDNAWIVGLTGPGTTTITQTSEILRWNGQVLRSVPFPEPQGTALTSVSATSPTDAWAVGYYITSAGDQPIALHWNGTVWQRATLPRLPMPASGQSLISVSAISASDAWALGSGFTLRWNGSSWSEVPSAPAAAGPQIAVAATGTDDAWLLSTVAGRWNGTDWITVPVPLVTMHGDGRGGQLLTLAASGSTAWVAGTYCTSPFTCANGEALPMLLRWDGSSWQQTFPLPSAVTIFGVAATSPANAWAVGYTWATDKRPNTTLILHWNGTTWS